MIKGWATAIFVMLILISNVHSQRLMEWGDGGKQFANETAELMCQDENAKAVYACLGNVVKVVSQNESEGSTFYESDGNVVYCPDVAPTDMGAECLQMLMPNYCPEEAVCGYSAPEVFPGQAENVSLAEEPVVGEAVEVGESVPQTNTVIPVSETKAVYLPDDDTIDAPVATPAPYEFAMSNLSLVILFLGLSSVGVLFMLFKKSINEEL